jgi:hypothetical protein
LFCALTESIRIGRLGVKHGRRDGPKMAHFAILGRVRAASCAQRGILAVFAQDRACQIQRAANQYARFGVGGGDACHGLCHAVGRIGL